MQIIEPTKKAEIEQKQQIFSTQKAEFLEEYARLEKFNAGIQRQQKMLSALDSQREELNKQAKNAATTEQFTEIQTELRNIEQLKSDYSRFIDETEMKKQEIMIFLSSKKQKVKNVHSELMETYGFSLINQTLEQSLEAFTNGIIAVLKSSDFRANVRNIEDTTRQDISPQKIVIASIVERLEKALKLADDKPSDEFILSNTLPLAEFENVPFISPMKAQQIRLSQVKATN